MMPLGEKRRALSTIASWCVWGSLKLPPRSAWMERQRGVFFIVTFAAFVPHRLEKPLRRVELLHEFVDLFGRGHQRFRVLVAIELLAQQVPAVLPRRHFEEAGHQNQIEPVPQARVRRPPIL